MNKQLVNTLIVLGVFYVLGFIFSAIIMSSEIGSVDLVKPYEFQWYLARVLEYYADIFPVIHISGILISFSLFTETSKMSSGNYVNVIKTFIIFLLIFMILYMVLTEVITSGAISDRTVAERESAIAYTYKNKADTFYNNNKNDEAIEYYNKYLDIDRSNREIELRVMELEKDKFENPSDLLFQDIISETTESADSRSYYVKALDFYEQGDYMSAYYYAESALRGDPGMSEARTVLNNSRNKIITGAESEIQRGQRAQYSRKYEAFLQYQKKNFEDAYYNFVSLRLDDLADLDVTEYIRETRSEISKTAFFTSELVGLEYYIPIHNVLFQNRNADWGREYVFIERVVYTTRGTYMFNVEVMQIAHDGTLRLHQRSPYGKIIDNLISFRCLGDTYKTDMYIPVSLFGDATVQNVPSSLFSKDYPLFSISGEGLKQYSIGDLLKGLEIMPLYGYDAVEIELEILNRLVRPISFIIISFFAMAFAFALRSKYLSRPPVSSYILMFTIPFIVSVIAGIVVEIVNMGLLRLLMMVGFVPGIVITLISLVVLLLVSILALAKGMVKK